MRNLIKFVAVVLFIGVAASVNAQTPKFGHIDLQALIQIMPERAAAETQFNTFQSDLEDIFGEMQKDLQTKMTEFEALGDSASEIKKNAKIAEIQDMQQRIQNYQQTAQ
ncbi:MAG: OmpH family outer membrane protein, partial [Bacteroidales bacterium]|nr:OmpH family outer membrane protein [Bacteroidales bacterium]